MSNENFDLIGARAVEDALKGLHFKVQQRARTSGLRKAGAKLRARIRQDARSIDRKSGYTSTGLLAKSIGTKYSRKRGVVIVGLVNKTPSLKRNVKSKYQNVRYYYKTLDFRTKRGMALNPWFEKSINRHKVQTANDMVKELELALFREAGKFYQASLSGIR